MADFSIRDEGSVVLLYPESDAAEAWAEAHISDEALHWAAAVVIEHRYVQDILDGIRADGLVVE
jgi:hypothetical protein